MTDLPRNWTRTPLGNACAILDFKRIPINSKERQARISGKPDIELFPYYGATGQVDVIDGYLFEGEHVLLGEDGAPFLDPFRDKAYIVDGKFWVNNHAHILKAHGSNRYLSHYLNAVRYEDHVSGTTRPKLTKRALMSIPVALPPLNEQHRIVEGIEALFDEIDRGVESLQDAKRAIGLYRQSLLKSAFEGRLTADWRAANPDKLDNPDVLLARISEQRQDCYNAALHDWERALSQWREEGGKSKRPAKPKRPRAIPAKPIDNGIPGWTTVPLGLVVVDPIYGTPKKCGYGTGATGVLRIPNIGSGRVDPTDLKSADFDETESARFSLQEGDVLTVRSNGSLSIVGKPAMVRRQHTDYLFAGYLIRLRPIAQSLVPKYLVYMLMEPRGRAQIETKAKSTSGVNNISAKELQELNAPICSLEEQAKIVRNLDAHLEATETLDAEVDASLARADALRQSILKKAFAGELAPQDPTDEPASALLARIRAERDTEPSKRPKRRAQV